MSLRQRENRNGWLFVAPATLHLLLFAILPIGFTLYLSLFRWKLYEPNRVFLGLANYAYSLRDPAFLNALANSFKYAFKSILCKCYVPIGFRYSSRGQSALMFFFGNKLHIVKAFTGVG